MTQAEISGSDSYSHLASYRRCVERITDAWPGSISKRSERLRQGLFDAPVEKIAENVLEDLFTKVLDWDLSDVNLQVGRADIVLSELGVKRLVLEVKRPRSLGWHNQAFESGLDQARRYAATQKVGVVAVSDARLLYAADVAHGGLRPRLVLRLDVTDPPVDLWWLSVHGIYRPCPTPSIALPPTSPGPVAGTQAIVAEGELLHHKYHLPVGCFAYVGSTDVASTWKLPYLLADGAPDLK